MLRWPVLLSRLDKTQHRTNTRPCTKRRSQNTVSHLFQCAVVSHRKTDTVSIQPSVSPSLPKDFVKLSLQFHGTSLRHHKRNSAHIRICVVQATSRTLLKVVPSVNKVDNGRRIKSMSFNKAHRIFDCTHFHQPSPSFRSP